MLWLIIFWIATIVVAFVSGLLVYRHNAKKFAELEAKARAKGKTVEELVKDW